MGWLDTIQHAIAWVLTWEAVTIVVGFFVGVLTFFGVPPMLAPVIVIAVAFFVFWKISTDRYLFQRWRWKLRRFLRCAR